MLHWTLAACVGFGVSTGSAFLLLLSFLCPLVTKFLEHYNPTLAPLCRRLYRCERADDSRFRSQALTERSTGTHGSCTFVGATADNALSPYSSFFPEIVPEVPTLDNVAVDNTWIEFDAGHESEGCFSLLQLNPRLYGLMLVYMTFLWLWALFRLLFFVWLWNASFDSFKSIASVHLDPATADRLLLHLFWSLPEADANASRFETIGALGDCALLGIASVIFPLMCEIDRALKEAGLPRSVVMTLYGQFRSLAKYFAGTIIIMILFFVVNQAKQIYSSSVSMSASLWSSVLVHLMHVFAIIYGFQFLRSTKNRRRILSQASQLVHGVCLCVLRLLLFSLAASALFYVSYAIAIFQTIYPPSLVKDLFIPSLILHSFSGLLIVSIIISSPICWHSHGAMSFRSCHKAIAEQEKSIVISTICAHCNAPINGFAEKDAIFVSAVFSHIDGSTLHFSATSSYISVLRALLYLHKGHEIGISEKGLRLAFHSIRDAVEYCFQVELEWNDNAVLGRKTYEEAYGDIEESYKPPIAMQMAIYDAECTDEQMLHEIHHVFKKHLIRGQMEDVRRSTSLFAGNRLIVVTQHIADWLHKNGKSINEPFAMHYIGSCDILHRSQSRVARSFKLYRLGSRKNQSTSESIISKVFEATASLTGYQDMQSPRMTSYTLFDNTGLSWDANIPVLSSFESKIVPSNNISPAYHGFEEWGIIRASNTCSIPMLSSPAYGDQDRAMNEKTSDTAPPDADFQNIVVFKLFTKRSQRRTSQMIFL